MKLKKIFALAVVAMMALSSVASAAITQDGDGWYLQDTLPTKAAVSARAVSVTPSVEKIDLETAKTFGITAGKGSSAKTDENTDFYKLTMTVNDIGELYAAYDTSSDYGTMWSVKMFNIAITVPGAGTNKQAVTSSTFEGKSWSIGGDGLQLTYGANSNEAYPAYAGEEGVYVNNPEVSVVAVYAVAKGYTINVQPTVKITYAINGTEDSANAEGVGTTNVVFAAPTTYTYTFKDSDGTLIGTVGPLTAGATVTAPTAPTKVGVTFDHWSDEANGSAVDVDATASDNKTYFAVYVSSAPAYDVIPVDTTEQAAKVVDGTEKTYTGYDNAPVPITKGYAIARFKTDISSTKSYTLHAEAAGETPRDFAINFGLLEVAGTANFVAIIKGAPAGTTMEIRTTDK